MPDRMNTYITNGIIRNGDFPIKRPPKSIRAIYDKRTTHPCQVIGRPQPTPYFIAGNQNSFFFSFILSLLLVANFKITGLTGSFFLFNIPKNSLNQSLFFGGVSFLCYVSPRKASYTSCLNVSVHI